MTKTSILRTAFLLFVFTSSFISQTIAQTWVPIWNDEFNYTGTPDATKWTYDVGGNGWGNSELQYYTNARAENARVENGNLIIEARKESYQGSDYTSARLISKGLGDWKYGKIEVRAKLPNGNGMWPAIWMLPTDNVYGNWPKSGEIDIMENVGHDADNVHWNVHTESYNHSIGTNKGATHAIDQPYNDFHTYAIEWYEDSILFLVDSVPYFLFNKESNDYKVWPFKEQFHLLLNVAVGGSWGGAQGIDQNIFPQQMEVDFVRVFKLSPQQVNYTCDVINLSHGTGAKSPNTAAYAAGSSVQLMAQPDNGFVFSKWYGTIQDTASTLNLTMNLNYEQTPEFVRSGEMLNNSQFLAGEVSWGGYGAPMLVDNGIYATTITSATNNIWDIQMSQGPLSLTTGESYTVTIVASASQSRDISAALGMSVSPWTSYGSSMLSLTTTPHTFTFQVNMGSTDVSARAVFDLGGFVGDVNLQEVSVVKNPTVTVVRNTELMKVFVAPNPFRNSFSVNFIAYWTSLKILDMTGKVVFIDEIYVPNKLITPALRPGQYLIVINGKSGTSTEKLIKL
jgi:beta-glucanase (GH16 family)